MKISQEINNKILALATQHNLNLPLPRGGPCLYSLTSEDYEQVKQLLQPLEAVDEVKALLVELGSHEP